MVDEYSDMQTDQITEIFKRAIEGSYHKRLDNRGEFAGIILQEVIWELEQQRAIWPDVCMIFNHLANKYRQIPLSERG